jgi:hypothetical protein
MKRQEQSKPRLFQKETTPMHESLRERLQLCQQILESILDQAPARAFETRAWPALDDDEVPSGAD